MGAPKTPVQAKDFMPSQWMAKAAPKQKLNRKRIALSLRGFLTGQQMAQQNSKH